MGVDGGNSDTETGHKSADRNTLVFRSLLFVAGERNRKTEPHVNFGAKRRKREASRGREYLLELEPLGEQL